MMRRDPLAAKGIRRRAAEIRRQWTPDDYKIRSGLPPDMPKSLRDCLAVGFHSARPRVPTFHVDPERLSSHLPKWWPIDLAFTN
jgi:hypothetical protein